MATVSVIFGRVDSRYPVLSEARAAEVISSSGSSQSSTGTCAAMDDIVEIAVSGGPIWVTIAASPTAVAGTTYLLPDGSTRHFSVGIGDKVAVIDA